MPVPTAITDLSQTAASNFPAGSNAPSVLDDVQRAHASFIAMLRDGKGFSGAVALASAATTDIGAQNALTVEVSGTTTITSLGANYNGPRFLRFTGALTLTHNAATLNLPGAANITTVAGDTAIAIPNLAANGWNIVSFTRPTSPVPTQKVLDTANGYGSTGSNKIRRFANLQGDVGTDVTVADSVPNGMAVTINVAGVYAIGYTDNFNTASSFGLSLNASSLTTGIASLAAAQRLAMATTGAADYSDTVFVERYFAVNDVIRAHAQTSNASGVSPALSMFSILRTA